jgi:aquaporin Z
MALQSIDRPDRREPLERAATEGLAPVATGDGRAGPAPADDEPRRTPMLRRVLAEVIGTATLTFAGVGVDVVGTYVGHHDPLAAAFAPGFAVLAMVFALGDVSGAHLNPAVTFAFWLRRDLPFREVLPYWAAQVVGATGIALLLRALFGAPHHAGATLPEIGTVRTFALEIVLTVVLIGVILNVSSRARLIGPAAGLPVGFTIVLLGLVAVPATGASMNPARSFGPALVVGALDTVWPYVTAPFIGAALAVGIARAMHPRRDSKEVEAARGA